MNQSSKAGKSVFNAWFVFAIVALFFLFEFVARVEPSLASQEIQQRYNINNAQFGALSSVFFWIYAPMQLIVGLLLDRYGPKYLVPPAILILSAGLFLFAFTADPLVAAFGRFLTGLGASFGFVSGLYVVSHYFVASRFAMLSGMFNAIGMLGTAVGAVWLTSAIEDIGWQMMFYASALFGLALFVLAFFGLDKKETKTEPEQAFLRPLKTIIKDGRIWWIAFLGTFFYMPINVFGGLWGKSELTVDHGLSPVASETAVSMIFWGMAAGSIAAGGLSDKFGHRKWIIVLFAVSGAVALSAGILSSISSEPAIAIWVFLGGFFCGGQMLTFAMAKESYGNDMSGTALALVNMVGIGGALVFQPLIGFMVDYYDGQYHQAMYSIPICLMFAAFMALFISDKLHSDHQV